MAVAVHPFLTWLTATDDRSADYRQTVLTGTAFFCASMRFMCIMKP